MPTPTIDISSLTPDQIRDAIVKLSPERLQALRLAAAQSGLAAESEKFRRLPNGSIQMQITIPVDLAASLMTLVEAVNEPAHPYIEGILLQGLNAWFIGGPEEETPAVVSTTTIPIGTPSGTATTTTK